MSRSRETSLIASFALSRRLIFFRAASGVDSEIFGVLESELLRQQDEIELIASENDVASGDAAVGAVLTNKYAEGYPGSAITAAATLSTLPRNLPSIARN